MTDIDKRLAMYDKAVKDLSVVKSELGENCFSSDGKARSSYDLANAVTISGRIGSDSMFGEVYKVITKKSHIPFALKLIPVSANPRTRYEWTVKEVFNESRILAHMIGILERNQSPNVPLSYGLYVCNQCKYQNKNLIRHDAPNKCAIVATELANTDISHWRRSMRSGEEWKSYIFQVLHGLAAAENAIGMVHNDLHLGNVLVTEVKKGGYWHYRFILHTSGGRKEVYDYYVKNTGQQWKIWDFGQSDMHPRPFNKAILKKMFYKDVKYHIDEMVMFEVQPGEKYAPVTITDFEAEQVDASLAVVKKRLNGKNTKCAVPAFEMIAALGWFTEKPKDASKIINRDNPYTIELREY
jgi:serine/threonine protein kinase